MKQNERVLIDTNAIIEAHRLNCWSNLISFFTIETVDMCARECATGQQHRTYVQIDTNALRQSISVHDVTNAMRLELICREPSAVDLDDGEKDLLAFAMTLPPDAFLICSPDKACMMVAARLALIDQLVSLQKLADQVGQGRLPFRQNYTEQWHRRQCTAIQLEIL